MTNVLKKAFTWSVVAVTLLWSVGFAALAPMMAQAAECPELETGDLWKTASKTAVYMQNEDGGAMAFPNEKTFLSWGFSFADVVTLSNGCAEDIDLVGFVPYAPGTLVYREGFGTVYAVGFNGAVTPFENYTALDGVFGTNAVATSRTVGDSHWLAAYDNTGDELDGTMLPDGIFVKTTGSSDVYFVMDGMLYDVEGTVSAPWRVVTVSAGLLASVEMADESMTPAEIAEMALDEVLMGSGTGTPGEPGTPVTGSLSLSLAASTPDSQNVVINVDNVVFSKFVLANGGSSDVKVNSVRIVRKGLGATGNITSVTLYDGSTKLGESRTSWTSGDYMTYSISGGWTIPAGSSKTLTVVAKLGTASTYNALGISEVTTASGATVSGLPVYGNEMAGVSVTVGTVTVSGRGTTSVSRNIGTTDTTVAEFRLALSSVEDASFKSITLKNKGTASDSDVANLYLKKGSTVLAGPATMVNDEVTFVLDSAYAMEKSKSYDFKVVADLVDGAARTVEFVLNNSTDLSVMGDTYNTNLTVTRTDFDETGDSGTTAVTISGAELNIAFTSAAKETVDDQTDFEFGRITLSAGGTDVDIDSIVLGVDEVNGDSDATNNKDIDELELVDAADGTAYSATMAGGGDTDADNEEWTFTDNIYLEAGVSRTFIIRGDIPDGVGDGDQYRVTSTINTTNLVAETKPAGDSVSNFSVSSYTGQFVTVRTPYLKVRATDANNSSAVAGSTGVLVYSGSLEAVAGDVTVDDLTFVGANATAANTSTVTGNFDEDNWTDLYFYVKVGGVWVEKDHLTSSDLGDGTFTFDGFSDFVVTSGSANKVEFQVKGTLESSLTANTTVHLQLQSGTVKDVDGDDAGFKNSAGSTISATYYPLERVGTLTLTDTGILYLSMRNADSGFNKDRFVLAGEGAWVGKLRVKADYEDIRIEDLKLTNTSADDEDSAASVCLYSAQEAIAANMVACSTVDSNDVVTFDNFNKVVTAGTHDWYIYVMTNAMNDGAGVADTNDSFTFKVTNTSTASSTLVAYGVNSGDALSFGNNNGTAAGGEIVFDEDLDGNFDEAADDETATTKTFTVVGSKIADVDLVSSYGGETVSSKITGTGTYTVAILKVSTAANSNTDASGQALKLAFSHLTFDVTKHTSTTISAVTLKRIGGVTSTLALSADGGDGFAVSSTGQTAGDWVFSNVTGSAWLGEDALVDAGQTAYFVVKATVGSVDTSPSSGSSWNDIDWIKVDLDSLNSGTNNIDWLDGYDTGYAVTNDFDTVSLDKSSVEGVKVSE